MVAQGQNRFERHRKPIYISMFIVFTALLFGLGLVANKVLNDEVNRGIERYIILREPRPYQDLSKSPSQETLKGSQGLQNRKYRLRVDSNGFIIPSNVHEKADVSIVFLGGSTTECEYMDEEIRFPYLVGRNLEQNFGKSVNSYNTAKAGNNTLHSLFILQSKIIPMHPQAVILMECINDLTTLLASNTYWTPHYTRGIIGEKEYNSVKMYLMENIRGHQSLTSNGKTEFQEKYCDVRNVDIDEICSSFKKNLELFIFVCKQHNIKPILMTQFNRMSKQYVDQYITPEQLNTGVKQFGVDHYKLVEYYAILNNVYKVVAKEQGVQLIDLDTLVPKTTDYMYDAVHLTPKGSATVAGIISSQLVGLMQ